jgi:hypothetical protein
LDLSTSIISVFSNIDDRLKSRCIRQRGPAPKLSDAEVLTIEIVGEFLGIDTDKGIYLFFRVVTTENGSPSSARYTAPPSLGKRPTSGRSRSISGRSSSRSLLTIEASPSATLCPCRRVCSLVPTALSALQRGGGRFRQGHPALRQTFYGFRVHVRVCWPGVITRFFSVAPANAHELCVLPELAEGTFGLLIGDRNYHSPKTAQELAGIGVELLAPYSSKKRDPTPEKSAFLRAGRATG